MSYLTFIRGFAKRILRKTRKTLHRMDQRNVFGFLVTDVVKNRSIISKVSNFGTPPLVVVLMSTSTIHADISICQIVMN